MEDPELVACPDGGPGPAPTAIRPAGRPKGERSGPTRLARPSAVAMWFVAGGSCPCAGATAQLGDAHRLRSARPVDRHRLTAFAGASEPTRSERPSEPSPSAAATEARYPDSTSIP